MKHHLLGGIALVLLAPILASAQEPPKPPITATPLMPPSTQYPTPSGTPLPNQPQTGITQPGVIPPSGQAPGVGPSQPGQPTTGPSTTQPIPPSMPQVQPPAQPGAGQVTIPPGPSTGQPGAPLSPPGQPSAPGQPPGEGQPQGAGPQPAPPPPNVWVPQAGATLQALDKVNAQTTTLTIKDGQTATFGSLNITVQACLVRPPDMPRDATAYLTIVDGHPNEPGFHGWMLESEPSLSMLEHPLYDVRVIGCMP